MKKIILLFTVVAALFSMTACQDMPISFLEIKDLQYSSSVLKVVQGLTKDDMYVHIPPAAPWDPPGGMDVESKYYLRIKNKSPWVGPAFYGSTVEGGRPLTVTLENVKTEGDMADVVKFTQEVKVFAEGRVEVPFENSIPVGKYVLTLRITNINTSKVAHDVFTVIVTTEKEK